MSFIYTRAQLKSRINGGIHGRIGVLVDENDFVDDVMRSLLDDLDLMSTKRIYATTQKLFANIFAYSAPSDIKGDAIIDIPPQVKKDSKQWYLVLPEEFQRLRERGDAMIAFDFNGGVPSLLLSKNINDDQQVISELDSLSSGGGTWQAYGDAENLAADGDNYVKGSAAVQFDINSSGGTTAGIKNTGLNTFSLDDGNISYLDGNGALFVWVGLSNADDITSFSVELGLDGSNFLKKTITAAADGTAFKVGYQLLRFDLSSLLTTGTPGTTNFTYAAIYMNKSASKVSQTSFHFDWIVLKRGQIYEIKYYSRFPWVSSSGSWKEISTDDGDYVAANSEEYELAILKGKQMAAEEANEFEIAGTYERQYLAKSQKYARRHPSERNTTTSEYYKF